MWREVIFINLLYFDIFSIYGRNCPILDQAGSPWDRPGLLTGLEVFHAPTKCIWSNASKCRWASWIFTSGCPSEDFWNDTPLAPTSRGVPMNCIPPRHTTNVVKNNVVVTKTAPVLCLVIFHQYEPLFTPAIQTNAAGRTTLPLPDIAYQDYHPQKRYINVLWGRQINFKMHTTNGQYCHGIQTFCQYWK